MISEVSDAFNAAGTPEDKARKAAEVLTNYDPVVEPELKSLMDN